MVFLAALAYLANVKSVFDLKMHRRPPGWYLDAIPPALSTLEYGHPSDYTGLVVVRDEFRAHVRSDDAEGLNPAIQAAAQLSPGTMARTRYLLGADDKGVVDFVKVSFLVFGQRVESFQYLYLLLLGVCVALFLIRHWDQGWPLLFPVAYLGAHLVVLPTISINPQVKGVIAMRFIPALSLLPFLDAVISIRPANNLGWRDFLFVGQATVFMFIMNVRSSVLSQFAMVLVIAGGATAVFLARRRNQMRRPDRPVVPLRGVVGIWWPGLVLGIALATLTLYQKCSLAEEYRRGDEIAGRVFWHSLYSGWTFQPELARRESLKIDDVSVMAAAGRYLNVRGRHQEFRETGLNSPGYSGIRWTPYDRIVREMYFDTWRRDPWRCATGMFLHKPLAFLRYGAWLMGLGVDPPYTQLMEEGVAREHLGISRKMRSEGMSVRLHHPLVLVLLITCGVLLARSLRASDLGVGIRTLGFWVGGLSSIILVYPVPHTMGEALVASITAVYVFLGTGCAWLTGRILNKTSARRETA